MALESHTSPTSRLLYSPAHSQPSQELVAQGLGLGDGTQTPRGHLLGVELHGREARSQQGCFEGI